MIVKDTLYLDERVKYYNSFRAGVYKNLSDDIPVNLILDLPDSEKVKLHHYDTFLLESTLYFENDKTTITAINPLDDYHCDAVSTQLWYLWKYIRNRPDSAHLFIIKDKGIYYLDIPYNEKAPLDDKGKKFFHLTANYISDSVFLNSEIRIRIYEQEKVYKYIFENNDTNYVVE